MRTKKWTNSNKIQENLKKFEEIDKKILTIIRQFDILFTDS